MVAREGSAPSISGCRPDVMLLGFPSLANQFPDRGRSLRESQAPPGGRSSTCQSWLPGLESHQHSRLQRALSYDWTTRQRGGLPSEALSPDESSPPSHKAVEGILHSDPMDVGSERRMV